MTILGLIVPCFGGLSALMMSEIVDCFKMLLLDFVINCLIILADIYVLIS